MMVYLLSGRWLFLLGYQTGSARVLREAEDHELSGFHWCDTDLADHLAGVDALARVGLVVALDVEGFVRCQPEQRTLAPLVDEECADRPAQLGPQRVVVRFEDGPVRAREDRLLQVVEQAADVHIPPCRVG